MKEINPTQELVLQLLERATIEHLDGHVVAKSLRKRLDLWEAAVITTDDLLTLRDLPGNWWHADTLYLLAPKDPIKQQELEALALNWCADEVEWLSEEEAGHRCGQHPAPAVLRLWWD